MKNKFLILTFLLVSSIYSQNEIAWDGKYQLQQSDFQSPSTQIGNTNIYNLSISSGFEFSFSMSNVQFMFTKNFNSKVTNAFKPKSAALVASDVETAKYLIDFAQFQFNLSELYARILRKRLYEGKKTFSNISFFKPIYDEIQNEYSQRITNASKETEIGKKKEKLKLLKEHVLKEIDELSNFCKECKILKKLK